MWITSTRENYSTGTGRITVADKGLIANRLAAGTVTFGYFFHLFHDFRPFPSISVQPGCGDAASLPGVLTRTLRPAPGTFSALGVSFRRGSSTVGLRG